MNKHQYSHNETKWAMLCHLTGFLCFLFPFGNYIGIISIWLYKKEKSDLIVQVVKEVINFQIFCSLVVILLFLFWTNFFVVALAVLFMIFYFFEVLIATYKAKHGKFHHYKPTVSLFR